jgi:alpha-methylacyl-CoA racemase
MAHAAGHDIDYIALAGVLSNFVRGPGSAPVPPLNLVGDFGGGGLLLAFGVVCGVLEARTSGEGQVIDVAMVDGAAVLQTMIYGFRAMGLFQDPPGTNLLDTGAHFYEVYETADHKFVAVGAIEAQFYAELLARLDLDADALPYQMDKTQWPAMKERFAELFRTKTRDEWMAVFEGTDACVAPVLPMMEAHEHPHNAARGTFFHDDLGILQPSPAPRFSRTPAEVAGPPPSAGEHTDDVLGGAGFSPDEIGKLREAGAVA